MDTDLDARRIRLSVGEFSDFTIGPRDGGEGPSGVWRAQLGTHWHQQMRIRAAADFPATEFEVAIEGSLARDHWTIALNGRIDQLIRTPGAVLIREIKTVTRELPEGEEVLRADYPAYFVQLAAYAALFGAGAVQGELVFVEVSTGFTQTVALAASDRTLLEGQLARVSEFLALRLRARERLKHLVFTPPFPQLRPGQETAVTELGQATLEGRSAVLLEAPTGFGKTGVLLEHALLQLRAGHFERLIYLTGKATGQLQVARTLESMAPPAGSGGPAIWTVRPKPEHCINHAFHCVREDCAYLDSMEERWPASGLSRFFLLEDQPRDLPSLRAAGRAALICPYEITRAALPFNDIWIGDYNYVFAPANRGLFYRQPGFLPGRTLLVVDEAHNLPTRVADAFSHAFDGADAQEAAVHLAAAQPRGDLNRAWADWADFLSQLPASPLLSPQLEERARSLLSELGDRIRSAPLDYGALTPRATEIIWEIPRLAEELAENALSRLWWCRRPGQLSLTCLDAAPAIGAALREFGGVVLATATPGPEAEFAEACGLGPSPRAADLFEAKSEGPARIAGVEDGRLGSLSKRQTRRLTGQVVSGAGLLHAVERREAASLAVVRARTPWRDGAYSIAYDVRVDTTFQHRARHAAVTGQTIAALRRRASSCIAVFFPSYAYAESIAEELGANEPSLRLSLQPRSLDLARQSAWVEEGLTHGDALFLVLGSSFSESIDLLGGRIGFGMVVGPALPEVNPVQRARLAALASLGRQAAFRRVYQIPGMQKVNQALGRLVRAPGQRAAVLLHCRRFAETAYHSLLAGDYRSGHRIETEDDLENWLAGAG